MPYFVQDLRRCQAKLLQIHDLPLGMVCAKLLSRETTMKKILLVDNNREYRHAMATIVRRAGYDVLQADEVAQAIERSVGDRPDLIIMAVAEPAINDVEIAVWLKSNQFPFEIPVVIYTPQRTTSWISEALSNGAADVLTKPISSADVADVLRKHLPTCRNRPRPIPSPCFDSSP
jgi:CheY-like chemotaxis protein